MNFASPFSFYRALQIRRPISTGQIDSATNPEDLYSHAIKVANENSRVSGVFEGAVFANNEISLRDIQIWGFDYDYTIAKYTSEMNSLIYRLIAEKLVHGKGYPKEILNLKYDSKAVRTGLHYDTQLGLILKIDAFHKIQPNTVYKGHRRLSREEVLSHYDGFHVRFDHMSGFHGGAEGVQKMRQLTDLFTSSQIALLVDIQQLFIDMRMEYAPEYLYDDVQAAVSYVHNSGVMHQVVAQDVEQYVDADFTRKYLPYMLNELQITGRKLFLMTNSEFYFVDAGMKYLIGKDWRDLFDVVICSARKPKFFSASEKVRPFRRLNLSDANKSDWTKITKLEKGSVYFQGNLNSFTEMTGWNGRNVLYFGDHVYGDLAEPSLRNGWRTGAIISELRDEIEIYNNEEFRTKLALKCSLENLIERLQVSKNHENIRAARESWKVERDQLKEEIKDMMHPKFGSIFRCHNNPSYFFRRLSRFADLYTGHLCNFIHYPKDRTFYPKRYALPHERFFMRTPVFES